MKELPEDIDFDQMGAVSQTWLMARMRLSILLHVYVRGFIPLGLLLGFGAFVLSYHTHAVAFILTSAAIFFGTRWIDNSVIRTLLRTFG